MATLDPQFEAVVQTMVKQAANAADSLRNLAQPIAEDLRTDDAAGPDPSDRKEVTEFFKAEQAQLKYHEAVTSISREKSKAGALMSARIVNDFMGSMERDTKLFGTSRIRAIALEASRKRRHGSAGGPLQNRLYSFIMALERVPVAGGS